MMNTTVQNSNHLQQFIDWFRRASPYIHAHRGRTFVIGFGGEAIQSAGFSYLIHDIALLSSLGIRLVLVHGIRPQIEQCLQTHGVPSRYHEGTRITDESALKCVKSAVGRVRTEIESLLSIGLSNSPRADVRIRTASGNFITARPVGVRDGVDYGYTGEIRGIDVAAITRRLDEDNIVLISPIGYSPTGETFNLLTELVATRVAIALRAAKWICLTEHSGILDNRGQLVRQLTVDEAQHRLTIESDLDGKRQLAHAIQACQNGVERVHLISRSIEGALLLELFTREGIGTLISTDLFEHIRKATIDDIGGLLELIEPLETAGILVRRSREKLEIEISQFTVQERDGMIVACAALYPFVEEGMAELACLAVHYDYRGENRGDALLAFLEREARQLGMTRVFVLTTQTAHWFLERGFISADLESLPVQKQKLYNYRRNSKVFVKNLW
jgi:amino-acid N-acetyltransferase